MHEDSEQKDYCAEVMFPNIASMLMIPCIQVWSNTHSFHTEITYHKFLNLAKSECSCTMWSQLNGFLGAATPLHHAHIHITIFLDLQLSTNYTSNVISKIPQHPKQKYKSLMWTIQSPRLKDWKCWKEPVLQIGEVEPYERRRCWQPCNTQTGTPEGRSPCKHKFPVIL